VLSWLRRMDGWVTAGPLTQWPTASPRAVRICRKKKQQQQQQQQQQQAISKPMQPWSCLACTFVNEESLFSCSICDTPSALFSDHSATLADGVVVGATDSSSSNENSQLLHAVVTTPHARRGVVPASMETWMQAKDDDEEQEHGRGDQGNGNAAAPRGALEMEMVTFADNSQHSGAGESAPLADFDATMNAVAAGLEEKLVLSAHDRVHPLPRAHAMSTSRSSIAKAASERGVVGEAEEQRQSHQQQKTGEDVEGFARALGRTVQADVAKHKASAAESEQPDFSAPWTCVTCTYDNVEPGNKYLCAMCNTPHPDSHKRTSRHRRSTGTRRRLFDGGACLIAIAFAVVTAVAVAAANSCWPPPPPPPLLIMMAAASAFAANGLLALTSIASLYACRCASRSWRARQRE
jgi:hypothetical protein